MKNLLLPLGLFSLAMTIFAGPRYDFYKLKQENLGRGVIAIRDNADTVTVSWRYLSDDSENEAFDVYRDGKKLNSSPIKKTTFFKDPYSGKESVEYAVVPVQGKKAGKYTLLENAPEGYLNIPLSAPG